MILKNGIPLVFDLDTDMIERDVVVEHPDDEKMPSGWDVSRTVRRGHVQSAEDPLSRSKTGHMANKAKQLKDKKEANAVAEESETGDSTR